MQERIETLVLANPELSGDAVEVFRHLRDKAAGKPFRVRDAVRELGWPPAAGVGRFVRAQLALRRFGFAVVWPVRTKTGGRSRFVMRAWVASSAQDVANRVRDRRVRR